MDTGEVVEWMNSLTQRGAIWLAKRLSVNDTDRAQTHQAGVYIPKRFLFEVFPSLAEAGSVNPRAVINLKVESHQDVRQISAIYYNQKTRNETRFTGFGGQSSPFQDPLAAGAIAVFVFSSRGGDDASGCHAWVCRNEREEDAVEERLGPIDPGCFVTWLPTSGVAPSLFAAQASTPVKSDCRLAGHEMPKAWRSSFPTGAEILAKAIELRPARALAPDPRLLRRRACEYEVFLSVEEFLELPSVRTGFQTIETFVAHAQSVLQRRKSRSGRSLELHARQIFIEEGLREDADFAHGKESEPGRRPDFIFPSVSAYRDPGYPDSRLRMLGAKTTAKDRWRQVRSEADRIAVKHVLTLQEGVTETQYSEMKASNVVLVVPKDLHIKYPPAVRRELVTFEKFINEVKTLRL